VSVVDVIAAKRDGREVAEDHLREPVLGDARGEIPDYQMAAFLMAGRPRGFNGRERQRSLGRSFAGEPARATER
jgi:pyrimidine-nucleoside phosphorylase